MAAIPRAREFLRPLELPDASPSSARNCGAAGSRAGGYVIGESRTDLLALRMNQFDASVRLNYSTLNKSGKPVSTAASCLRE